MGLGRQMASGLPSPCSEPRSTACGTLTAVLRTREWTWFDCWDRRAACWHQCRDDAFLGYLMLGDEDMSATSKAQQKAAGAALAAKRGDQPKSKLRGASKQMEESMTEKQLEEFASIARTKLPAKKG